MKNNMKFIPKIGLITLGDPREEVPWRKKEEDTNNALIKFLRDVKEIDLIPHYKVVRNSSDIKEVIENMRTRIYDTVIIYIPVWTYPSITVKIAGMLKDLGIPLIIVYSDGVLSGILASVGALKQVGINHRMIYGKIEDNIKEIINYSRACMAINRLKGMTYGVFGGRALGMYTTIDDPIKWQRVFRVDIDHIDQLEIIREAEKVSHQLVKKYMKWVENNFGSINYDNKVLTEEKLERQVRIYLALKKLIKSHNFDFCGLKCQPELSDKYVNACLAVALVNDPYDAEGEKEPIACACEVDHDGALTMQVLKIISGGLPTTLMDILVYDKNKELLFLANCGGMATWFTKRSNNPRENLKKAYLLPQIQGKAGGAAIQYIAEEGIFTIARLFRVKDDYKMIIIRAKSVKVPREELKRSMWPWPHIVIKISKSDFRKLINTTGANHLHATYGDFSNELKRYCEIMKIDYTFIDSLT